MDIIDVIFEIIGDFFKGFIEKRMQKKEQKGDVLDEPEEN